MEDHLMLDTDSGSRTWYARTRTEANLSDFPSRKQNHHLLLDECDVSANGSLELDKLLHAVNCAGDG